jgi:penicillin-binding protein 1C
MGKLAVYYLRQILEGSPPPPGIAYAAATGGRSVAFKTGTSYGFRDAWAVGYSARWTVGVWTGRVEGTPRPGAFGRATAAPLMLDAFGLLPPESAPAYVAPAGAIVAGSNADLPAGLRRLGGAGRVEGARPVLDYPPAGSIVDLVAAGGGYGAVTLRARGGEAPFRWLVNGVPQAGHGDELAWRPDGPGFAVVTLIDARDRAAGGRFRLQ